MYLILTFLKPSLYPAKLEMLITAWIHIAVSSRIPLGILPFPFLVGGILPSSEVPLNCPHILYKSICNHIRAKETKISFSACDVTVVPLTTNFLLSFNWSKYHENTSLHDDKVLYLSEGMALKSCCPEYENHLYLSNEWLKVFQL